MSHVVGLAGKQVVLSIKGDEVTLAEAPAGAAAAGREEATVSTGGGTNTAISKQVGSLSAPAVMLVCFCGILRP